MIFAIDDQLEELPSSDDRTDQTLVEYARQGSHAAFAVLIGRYGDAVYSIVRNMCATSSEANELTRQTFVSACREIASIERNASLRTWLCGTAIRTVLAQRQRGGRTAAKSSLEPFPVRCDGSGRLIPLAGKWRDLGDPALQGSELTGLLREALEHIDDGVRAAFVLCDLAELPAREAATLLQTSPREIRRRVHRARLMLTACSTFSSRVAAKMKPVRAFSCRGGTARSSTRRGRQAFQELLPEDEMNRRQFRARVRTRSFRRRAGLHFRA